jgi:hypothetical protein
VAVAVVLQRLLVFVAAAMALGTSATAQPSAAEWAALATYSTELPTE